MTARTGRPVGRPTVGGLVQLRMPDALLAEVDRLAAAEGLTRSAWIRRAIAARTGSACQVAR